MAFSDVNRLVTEQIPLDKLVLKYVKLERSSRGFIGLCPFHKEKTPSFHVNVDDGYYYCFGCGASGNAITFLMNIEGMTFVEALEKLAEDFRIPELVNDVEQVDTDISRERDDIFTVNKIAAKYFHKNLETNEGVRTYLRKRGVTSELEKKFAIGYLGDGRIFIEYMNERGVGTNLLMRSGLIRLDNSRNVRSFFYNRLMVPIVNRKKVIGFGGRILEGDGPKYINSPDTPVFNKKEHLYGIDFVRQGLKSFPFIVLCEGYFDVIAMHKAGFSTAVAALGTAVTKIHLRILARFRKPVVVFLDGDEAGRTAAKRIAELEMPPDIDLRVTRPDEGEDPDSIINKEGGVEKVRKLIETAKPLFQELIDEQIKKYNSSMNVEEKVKIEKKIKQIARNIPKESLSQYIHHIKQHTNNKINLFIKERKQEKRVERVFENEINPLEELLFLSCLYPQFIPALEEIESQYYSDKKLGAVFSDLINKYYEGEDVIDFKEKLDVTGLIEKKFMNRSVEHIERAFTIEHARQKFELNTNIIRMLKSDKSPETVKRISELLQENRRLKPMIANNEIDDNTEHETEE